MQRNETKIFIFKKVEEVGLFLWIKFFLFFFSFDALID